MTPPPSSMLPLAERRPVLICLSHLRWDFVTQRPQHLLSRAAADFDVIFVEEAVHSDHAEPGMTTSDRPGGIRLVQPRLPHNATHDEWIAHQRSIVERLAEDARAAGANIVLWYYTPMALEFSDSVDADVVVFDKMDELSAFRNAPAKLLELEQRLLDRADVVFTGGASMHRAAAHRHTNIHCFPSSIDASHFALARGGAVADPADQASVARPRLGFFGVIDERFDAGLVEQVAARRPDWQFVMIGPVVKIDPATLPRAANIHWLGGKQYAELPAYLAHWDIGFMPFAINESTRFISPTKTPEFLAAGLPVVSTAITDVVSPYGDNGLVEIASTPQETVAAVERCLSRDRAPWLARVDTQLAGGSWDTTWSAIRALILEKLSLYATAPGAASFNRLKEIAHV